MGVDSFTIHTDGVIERGQEMEPILLNIIEVGSHKKNILAAYKAQRKCFKISKKTRAVDYKEYIERLQLDHYPKEFEKSELGRRIVILIWVAAIGSIVFLIPTVLCLIKIVKLAKQITFLMNE